MGRRLLLIEKLAPLAGRCMNGSMNLVLNNTPPRIQKPRVPMVLTKSRLLMLIKLWSTGYDKGWNADRRETLACRELCRYGYAEVDPSCPTHFRITEDGINRLEAPMRLYQQARAHLRVVK